MKVSLNFIRAFNKRHSTSEDITEIGLDKLIDKIGSQLGAVDEVIEIGSKYKGAVIAKVGSCQKHDGADKLSVCMIDDGGAVKDVKRDENGLVQVVCGAPNVAAGQLVVWLPPGVTVPESVDNESLVLEAREIRGMVSNGMIASPKELALGDSHDGILVLEGDYKPGADFAEAFDLKDDVILDIENKMFTHRPDLFGQLGVAREIAGIQHQAFKSPDWYLDIGTHSSAAQSELPLEVKNELPELVKRFVAVPLKGIEIKPSPIWMQVLLNKLGMRPINNVVDLTNYHMLLTGQPLHAYDYDKVKAHSANVPTLAIRNPRPSEKLTLLNGKTIEPKSDTIMIATDKELIGVGGIMGGAETEVDENTKNIILECANFDMYSIRRSAMALGLFTDAVTRFTKGQSPLQNLAVVGRALEDFKKYANAEVAGPIIDDLHIDQSVIDRRSLRPAIEIEPAFINLRLGLELTAEEINSLLSNVEFKVEANGGHLKITPPFWRTDIELREDIVEEVGRLHGYDQLDAKLPQRVILPTERNQMFDLSQTARTKLAALGANEVLTYSFVSEKLLKQTGQPPEQAIELANALSPELAYYRLSLAPSLLDKVHPNIKAGYSQFALFEIGLQHNLNNLDDDGVPIGKPTLALVVAADNKVKPNGSAYYLVKKYLRALMGKDWQLTSLETAQGLDETIVGIYEAKRSALIQDGKGNHIGIIGEYKLSVINEFKLPKFSAGFEIDLNSLGHLADANSYRPLSKFPSIRQDITLSASNTNFAAVDNFIREQLTEIVPAHTDVDVEPLDLYVASENDAVHYTFRITLANHERTLTDKETNQYLDELSSRAKSKLNADRV